MTRRALLVITAINPIGHFADSQRDKRRVCRRAIFHLSITIEIAAYISNASYPDEYSFDIVSDHLSPRITNNRARPIILDINSGDRSIQLYIIEMHVAQIASIIFLNRVSESTLYRDSAIKYWIKT